MKTIIICLCLFILSTAETDYTNPMEKVDKSKVDKAFSTIPDRRTSTLERFTEELKQVRSKNNLNDAESAYLAFRWVASIIEYDCQNVMMNPYAVQTTADGTFRYGKAAGQGFSSLFIEVAKGLGLTANMTNGFVKGEDISYIGVEPNNAGHYWNLVTIDSKDYLVDTAWSSGACNSYYFIRNYKEYYFAPNPEFLIHTHFPEDSKFQLLNKTLTKKEFAQIPYLSDSFYSNGFTSISPDNVLIDLKEVTGKIYLRSKSTPSVKIYGQLLYNRGYNYYTEIPNSCNYQEGDKESTLTYMVRNRGQYILRIYSYQQGLAYASLLTQYKITYM